MTDAHISRCKELLETKRAELAWEISQRCDGLAVEDGGDPVDRASDLARRELAVRGLDLESHLLRRVRAALREIEEGTFGKCAWCNRKIPLKRLEAVPWSPYCLSCQEVAEAGEQDREEPHALAG